MSRMKMDSISRLLRAFEQGLVEMKRLRMAIFLP